MAHRTVVLLVVGLNRSLLGEDTPHLRAFADGGVTRTLTPDAPAVTCTVQSSMLTGTAPDQHGIVGNGWYNREMAEVQFWKQSNRLVRGEKVWETAKARDPSVTCANICWWYNMYSSVDHSVTPRPIYKADGRKIPDCYTEPQALRDRLQGSLGPFPLFRFWGPAASIDSTAWIANAAMTVAEHEDPTLSLVYLPHMDYSLQRDGPGSPGVRAELRELDTVLGALLRFYESRDTRVIVLSEYGIQPVTDAVHPNRVLRRAGLVRVREEQGLELLDAGASDAFAVADHQIAHVYVRDPARRDDVAALLRETDGIDTVTPSHETRGLHHERSGDLIAISNPDRWFSYYYWLDDARAPDFARTVDIHRKPGYDPVELFIDPRLRSPKLALATRLARKKLGFRTLMDVIPLDASLVRGSHGRTDLAPELEPVVIARSGRTEPIAATDVRDLILEQMFDPNAG